MAATTRKSAKPATTAKGLNVDLVLDRARETKNTWRYEAVRGERTAIQYVEKADLNGEEAPAQIRVQITAV